jgi:hypothetical protein
LIRISFCKLILLERSPVDSQFWLAKCACGSFGVQLGTSAIETTHLEQRDAERVARLAPLGRAATFSVGIASSSGSGRNATCL